MSDPMQLALQLAPPVPFHLRRRTTEHITVMAPANATDDELFRLADIADDWSLGEIETRIEDTY